MLYNILTQLQVNKDAERGYIHINPNYDSIIYWLALILPSLIAGVIAIVSLVTNSRNSKTNQLRDMVFAQKEKVADQFVERGSELIAITDPLLLNAKINAYTPTTIPHSQFMVIMQELLSIDTNVQTLSNTIKLHTWSIYTEETLAEIGDMFTSIDVVQELIRNMIQELIALHSSNTQEGRFKKSQPMVEKQELERGFAESYREPYISMSLKIMGIARLMRQEALKAKIENQNYKHRKSEKSGIR